MFVVHLRLLSLHHLALSLLPRGIFAYKAQTTIHLYEVLCGEDKHETVLQSVVAGKVTHRLHVPCLALLQLLLQRVELGIEDADVAVDVMNVFLNAVNVLLMTVNLAVYHHKIAETLLHVSLIGTQRSLLLLYLLLHGRALRLQSTNLLGAVLCLGRLLFPCIGLLLSRSLTLLCRRSLSLLHSLSLCRLMGGLLLRCLLRCRGLALLLIAGYVGGGRSRDAEH